MTDLSLSLAVSDNSRVRPLVTGSVAPAGIQLQPTISNPSEIFWRQLKFREFDVSEMSMSSLSRIRDAGDDSYAALPVFPVRRFFHLGIMVRDDANIESLSDLKGRNVAVPEYQQTAAVWSRGYLWDEHGVAPEDVSWFMERSPELSHAGATGRGCPEGIEMSHIPQDESIGTLFQRGVIDAAVHFIPRHTALDRSAAAGPMDGVAHRFFADETAEAKRYHLASGVVPINHCIVVKKEVLERHPWVADSLFDAFVAARDAAIADLREPMLLAGAADPDPTHRLDNHAQLYPYGVEPNRVTLETLSRYVAEQRLVSTPFEVDDFFHPGAATGAPLT